MNRDFLDRRFPDRREQVDKLLVYIELLGLTAKDLISLGCKMQREQQNTAKEQNMDLIAGFEILPIGKDPMDKYEQVRRFKLKTDNGAYNFVNLDFGQWEVYSLSTKKKIVHYTYQGYETNKSNYLQKLQWYLLLDIATDKLLLNF